MGKLIDKMMPAAFSPLYINEALLDSRKALALFKFTQLFFPQFGPGPDLVNLLLDMENQSRRVIAAVPLKEREQLINDLDGVTVELKCMIKDQGREMMTLPVTLLPAEVLRRAVAGKLLTPGWEKQRKEMERIIIALIQKEIQRKMKLVLEACLKPMMVKPRLPAMLKDLISRGLVSRDGRLSANATIMDLVSGRYARLFVDQLPEEVLNEAWIIQKTIQACARRQSESEEDYSVLAQEALRTHRMLEMTLKVMQQKQHKEKRDIPEAVRRHRTGHLRRSR
ncbi:MAG: hypothetical protein KJ964_11030 [Verrucomicrobia bacterium]|nr:hypothetical protein [Verrucomicrobiota bacterium]MBU1735851.1 hypothetical protein [Verrucomicrobiota bacterium]MBU1856019.1 hypothetical protein [Verrucomicrobiota bacterium]